MVFLLRPVVAYTLPQLQYQMKINIVPGDFTDMPECDFYCFRGPVYLLAVPHYSVSRRQI